MCQNIFMIWGKEEFLKRETVSKTQKGLMSLTVLKLKRHHTKQVTKRRSSQYI